MLRFVEFWDVDDGELVVEELLEEELAEEELEGEEPVGDELVDLANVVMPVP